MLTDRLPDDLDALHALVIALASERDAAIAQCRRVSDENDRLSHLLRQLQRAQFGRRSERLDADQIELALEDIETTIAEEKAHVDQQDTPAKPADRERKQRRANRGSLPAHLPRIHVTLAPQSTLCPCCAGTMHVIGEDTAERLDLIPAQYQVVVTHRPQYACRACEAAVCKCLRPSG
jgi:transposase